MPDYKSLYNTWLASDKVLEADKQYLRSIANDENAIKSMFSSYMSFGTAGLRSTMSPGTDRMNIYTVAHITQAIAQLIIEEGGCNEGVAIAYDSRINSELFAKTSASVLAANGVKVYIFDSVRPTPELSFALLDLGCIAGINITASHNPKEYNGYKVYWRDGAQLPVNHAQTVTDKAAAIDIFDDVKTTDFDAAVESGTIKLIGNEVDERYLSAVESQIVDKNAIKNVADTFKVVYSPLHGAGHYLVPEVLRRVGVKNLYTVEEQMVLDGRFPTVAKPNPEYPETFELAKKLANKHGCDLMIATDPDADRVAVTARNSSDEFVTFTGNQIGLLLIDYIISAYEQNNTMPFNPFVVKSLVSSSLADKICEAHNVTMYNVLTGFKYIGEMIKLHDGKDGTYIFGFEESCGYLKGTYARDKDAIVASMLVCEMAAHYMLKGKTLCDAMDDLYEKYGYSFEKTAEIVTDGLDAKEKQEKLMEAFRTNPPKSFGSATAVKIGDLASRRFTDLTNGSAELSPFPKADVLMFYMDNDDIIIVRPSGTEPKVKLYYLVTAENRALAIEKFESYKSTLDAFVNATI